MKKTVLSVALYVALFASMFIITYLYLCYCIPGFRIKLYASPSVYFIESLKNMVAVKSVISFAFGAIAGTAPVLVRKIRSR